MTYAKVGVHGRLEALTLRHDAREPRLGGGTTCHPRLGSGGGGGQGGLGGDKSPQSTVYDMGRKSQLSE